MPRLKTNEEFLKNLKNKNKHFEKGDITIHSNYKGKDKKIIVKNKHGYGKMAPHSLLTGAFLTIRSAIFPKKYLLSMFMEVHGYRYEYPLNDYVNATSKIAIKCMGHGLFYKTPNKHLCGEGCPKCKYNEIQEINRNSPTGWNLTNWKKASKISKSFDSFKVYIVLLTDENELFYKIGRTYTTISNRMKHIPYLFKILRVVEGSAKEMLDLETIIKSENKDFKYKPKKDFGGKTECFYTLNKKLLG